MTWPEQLALFSLGTLTSCTCSESDPVKYVIVAFTRKSLPYGARNTNGTGVGLLSPNAKMNSLEIVNNRY